MDTNDVTYQLKHTINYAECQSGDKFIDSNSSIKYFFRVTNFVNERENEHNRKK